MYLALPVSTGRFPRATHVSRYSRTETKKILYFRLRGHYPLGLCFPAHSTNIIFFNFSHINMTFLPYNPTQLTEVSCKFIKLKVFKVFKVGCISAFYFMNFITLRTFNSQPTSVRCVVWAPSFSLAATKEMSFLRTFFYFPLGTEMFYFPRYASRLIWRDNDI